jgi:hypothetical protein
VKRTDPYNGTSREVNHYAVISKDLDSDNKWREKDTWRFDIYEADPEAQTADYRPNGTFFVKGKHQVVHSRGGLQSKAVAEHLAMTEGLARGLDVKLRDGDNRNTDGPEVDTGRE